MSGGIASAENRHHLLLAEARQVNEFLDARLTGADVPGSERMEVAIDVLVSALVARTGVRFARQMFGAE